MFSVLAPASVAIPLDAQLHERATGAKSLAQFGHCYLHGALDSRRALYFSADYIDQLLAVGAALRLSQQQPAIQHDGRLGLHRLVKTPFSSGISMGLFPRDGKEADPLSAARQGRNHDGANARFL